MPPNKEVKGTSLPWCEKGPCVDLCSQSQVWFFEDLLGSSALVDDLSNLWLQCEACSKEKPIGGCRFLVNDGSNSILGTCQAAQEKFLADLFVRSMNLHDLSKSEHADHIRCAICHDSAIWAVSATFGSAPFT